MPVLTCAPAEPAANAVAAVRTIILIAYPLIGSDNLFILKEDSPGLNDSYTRREALASDCAAASVADLPKPSHRRKPILKRGWLASAVA